MWIRIANADPDTDRGKSAQKKKKIKSRDQKKIIKIGIFYAVVLKAKNLA
jgi:hypothetical protein